MDSSRYTIPTEMHSNDKSPAGSQLESPKVLVSFSGYKPPFDPVPIIRRMLDSVPKQYLVGLDAVVLANVAGLSSTRRKSKTRSRKRKVGLAKAAGLYHAAFSGRPAWIEIFVDNALRGWETGWWLKIPFVRDFLLANVLFHEIGHHIHRAIRPEHRETEDVADVWKVRLERNYRRQRFRWLGLFGRIIFPFFESPLKRQMKKMELEMVKSGQTSRAEFIERYGKE